MADLAASFWRRIAAPLVLYFAALFGLDALFFRYLIWQLPDEAAWSQQTHLRFEKSLRRCFWQGDSKRMAKRVVILGSSVADYSLLPDRLPESVEGVAYDYCLLSFQGLNWFELELLSPRIAELRPDIVVLLTNPVDQRLERPLMLESESTDLLWRDLIDGNPYLLALAPRSLRRLHGDLLSASEISQSFLAELFYFYRYRELYRPWISLLWHNRVSSGRRFHAYNGIDVEGDGVTRTGHLGREFVLRWPESGEKPGPDYEILLRAEPELIGTAKDEGEPLALNCIAADGEHQLPLASGWQRIDFRALLDQGVVSCRASHSYYSHYADDHLSIRLSERAGVDRPYRNAPRRLRREDLRFRALVDSEYIDSFEQRILRFDRAGMEYLHALEISKRHWSIRRFNEDLPSSRSLAAFAEKIRSGGAKVWIVNTPENPLSLAWYGDSIWYGEYLRYLERHSDRLIDESQLLPMQMFYDYHHLSYFGAELFSDYLVGRLLRRQSR